MTEAKKKLWIILGAVIAAVCIAVGVTLAVVLTAGHKHPLIIHGEKAPTCVANGNYVYWECETCQKYFSDERGRHETDLDTVFRKAYGHNVVNGKCSRCGYTVLPGTAHLSFTEIRNGDGEVVAYAFAGMGTSTEENLVIPTTYNDLPVIEITTNALKGNEKIVSVYIPSEVVTIGEGAFEGCRNLASITVDEFNTRFESVGGNLYTKGKEEMIRYAPSKADTTFTVLGEVKIIRSGAFQGATNLNAILMSQESKCQQIQSLAFQGCTNLKTVRIAPNVSSIGQDVFFNCGKLQDLTLPFVGASKSVGATAPQYPLGYLFGATAYNGGEATGQSFRDASSVVTTTVYYIPSTLKTVKVTGGALYEGAFYNCANIASVTLDGVKSIGSRAFVNCNVTEVYVSDSVAAIDEYAFSNCRALTIRCQAETQPSDWNIYWNFNGNPVVWNCVNNDTANDGNVYVMEGVLRFALNSNGQATVDKQPLYLDGDITIPSAVTYNGKEYPVTTIARDAFNGCVQVASITVPQSVTVVGAYAFANCQFLVIRCEAASTPADWDRNWNSDNCPVVWNCNNSEKTDDGNVYVIVNGIRYALKDSKATVAKQSLSLIFANIPATIVYDEVTYTVEAIAANAFANTALAQLILPSSITSIGARAFENCKNLTDITIPQTLTAVSSCAFWGCDALTIRCQASSKPARFVNDWCALSENADCPVVWNCSENDVATDGYAYIVLNNLRYALNVQDGVATVVRQSLALSGEITILSTITYLGRVIPILYIADYAFNGCTKLQKVTMPVSAQYVGSYAFQGCAGLVSATLPENISEISAGCFSGCTSLESITIPANVQNIQFNAFYGCRKLATVKFANNSKCVNIGGSAFCGCVSLTAITIPEAVTSIGKQAFFDCTSLKSVTFQNPTGWWYAIGDKAVTGTSVSSSILSNAELAAAELINKADFYWHRDEA